MRSLQQQPTTTVHQPASAALLQRQCACGQHTGAGGECTECKQKREGTLHRAAVSPAAVNGVPPIVHDVLRSPGQPLDAGTRAFMEPRFGHDFSGVRVHTDGRAAESARAVNALAYTVGRNVVFGAGQHAPRTSAGQRLMAHELTHVVQQGHNHTAGVQTQLAVGAVDDRYEHEAERIDKQVAQTMVGERSSEMLTQYDVVDLMRAPISPMNPSPVDKAAAAKATALETEILAHPVYTKLAPDSQIRVQWIITQSKTKPNGDAQGQRNYYLAKLKVAIMTPFVGKETGSAEYGCSPDAEKANKAEVEKALKIEKHDWDTPDFANVEEDAVATGTTKVARIGKQGKKFYVDRSDPKNIRVQIKVKLNGKKDEVENIKKLEDAIERASYTKGYYLDIVFVNTSGSDVFEFTVSFCQWANAGNWASGPTTLSHEVHHALGLEDRYDYIEVHAHNTKMNVAMRIVWFAEQMKKTGGPRDPYSKMHTSSKSLLAEDVCAVAFEGEADQKKCIAARKDLDPTGIPPI